VRALLLLPLAAALWRKAVGAQKWSASGRITAIAQI
jgi:hypothetical protein